MIKMIISGSYRVIVILDLEVVGVGKPAVASYQNEWEEQFNNYKDMCNTLKSKSAIEKKLCGSDDPIYEELRKWREITTKPETISKLTTLQREALLQFCKQGWLYIDPALINPGQPPDQLDVLLKTKPSSLLTAVSSPPVEENRIIAQHFSSSTNISTSQNDSSNQNYVSSKNRSVRQIGKKKRGRPTKNNETETEKTWFKMLGLLLRFREKNQDFNVPADYVVLEDGEEYYLGSWLETQKEALDTFEQEEAEKYTILYQLITQGLWGKDLGGDGTEKLELDEEEEKLLESSVKKRKIRTSSSSTSVSRSIVNNNHAISTYPRKNAKPNGNRTSLKITKRKNALQLHLSDSENDELDSDMMGDDISFELPHSYTVETSSQSRVHKPNHVLVPFSNNNSEIRVEIQPS
jgi:hypothetical protein